MMTKLTFWVVSQTVCFFFQCLLRVRHSTIFICRAMNVCYIICASMPVCNVCAPLSYVISLSSNQTRGGGFVLRGRLGEMETVSTHVIPVIKFKQSFLLMNISGVIARQLLI